MAAKYAEHLCPEAVFVPPDFMRYRAVSQAVREIFLRHTDLIEPLSLDETYLDVTVNKTGLATATKVASAIRPQIREELNLTASTDRSVIARKREPRFPTEISSGGSRPQQLS
jgi:DNA polymerase-4